MTGKLLITPTQLQLLKMVADGQASCEIAYSTNRSEQSIKNQVSDMLGRFGAKNRVHMVSLAYRWGVLPTLCDLKVPTDKA